MNKPKKTKEKQYAIQGSATYVVIADSLADAKKQLQTQLEGTNTIGEIAIGDGQALLPQIPESEYKEEVNE